VDYDEDAVALADERYRAEVKTTFGATDDESFESTSYLDDLTPAASHPMNPRPGDVVETSPFSWTIWRDCDGDPAREESTWESESRTAPSPPAQITPIERKVVVILRFFFWIRLVRNL
jgi:hypothetical protein